MDNWFDCEHPRLVKNKYTGELVQVSCGLCPACQVRKILRWQGALIRESLCHRYTFFITLTYSDKYLPIINLKEYDPKKEFYDSYKYYSEKSEEYLQFLDFQLPYAPSADAQRFIKRLRKYLSISCPECKIRYFIHSDYGSTLFRPHWHGLLWFDSDTLAGELEQVVSRCWSFYDSSDKSFEPFGRIDCQLARNAASYVSAYVQTVADLPAIYSYRDFKPRALHSIFPPLGSQLPTLETDIEIIRNGLTTVTQQDSTTHEFRRVPLSPTLVRRFFPAVPSFFSLTRNERLQIYSIFSKYVFEDVEVRRILLFNELQSNSFLRDYVTLNQKITATQTVAKLDRIHYAVKRLVSNCICFDISVSDYDLFIEKYFANRSRESLNKQLDYEQNFHLHSFADSVDLNEVLDIAVSKNQRHLTSLINKPHTNGVTPFDIDTEYFMNMRRKFQKLIKRKCDNAYLEKHPEYKKFHN